MKTIKVQYLRENHGILEQLKANRLWMDNTGGKHAYVCFPLTLTNTLGWGLSFNQDIRAVWDGIENSEPDHVTILEGHDLVHTGRGHGTISFNTGILINTDEDVSTLAMPVPNEFIRGAQLFTTLISTSFYMADFPLAMKITEPNREIYIKAGTPVATILPISVSNLQENFQMEITQAPPPPEFWDRLKQYSEIAQERSAPGEWSNLYRDAIGYDGLQSGKHETKKIKLKTITCPVTGATSVESTN